MYKREFLVWSQVKQALCCYPCRMLWHTTGVVSSRAVLASPGGWTASKKWRNLCVNVREHVMSKNHMECYIAERTPKRRVDSLLEASFQSEAMKCIENYC